jgi:hypothetical protein
MDTNILAQEYAFSDFPRVELPAKINRRRFFRDLINDLRTIRVDQESNPAIRLSGLGTMPDAQLARIVPLLLPGSQIVNRDGYLWGYAPGESDPIRLFPQEIPAASVFQRMDGACTLSRISGELSVEMSWEKNYALAYSRGVFLWLVLHRLVIPRDKCV